MAKMVVCAVFDSALDEFTRPFFVPTTAIAARSFVQEVNGSDSPVKVAPEDYGLYELGSFDSASGAFSNLERPQLVIRAKDVVDSNRKVS